MTVLTALVVVHDEEYYLPTYLDHLSPWVDQFIALDHNSQDSSNDILRSHPKVRTIVRNPAPEWDEAVNRRLLLTKAGELGARWVVCVDPDERLELDFLRSMGDITRKPGADLLQHRVRVKELWNSPVTYRSDGIWGRKSKAILFSLPDEPDYGALRRLHGRWYPGTSQDTNLPYSLYHLRMIRPHERLERWRKYRRVDPQSLYQKIGYDYLLDESALTLTTVGPGERYDLRCLPDDLRVEPMEG